MRKVWRSVNFHGGSQSEKAALVDALLIRLQRAGLLDDQRYATRKAGSLHRRGNSTSAIRGKLRAKGVGNEEIEQALNDLRGEVAEEAVDPDFIAAANHARKRRFGPYRDDPGARADRRQKDLAALARRGFRFDIARRVIDAETVDELLEMMEGGVE
jgi:regulatory protein